MPFKSTVGDYQTVATLETFGFLPPFTQDEIYDQIAYIIAQGWSPLVEHVHPSNSMATYWSFWKLPPCLSRPPRASGWLRRIHPMPGCLLRGF